MVLWLRKIDYFEVPVKLKVILCIRKMINILKFHVQIFQSLHLVIVNLTTFYTKINLKYNNLVLRYFLAKVAHRKVINCTMNAVES